MASLDKEKQFEARFDRHHVVELEWSLEELLALAARKLSEPAGPATAVATGNRVAGLEAQVTALQAEVARLKAALLRGGRLALTWWL